MIHLGRCGSTVLGDLLNQHHRIYWASELYAPILNQWQTRNAEGKIVGQMPEDAVDLLRKNMRLALHRYFGFEIKPFHFRLIGYSPESFLRHADSLGFTHFIFLNRKNRLRKILSSIVAHQDKSLYHVGPNANTRLAPVSINHNDVRIDSDAKPLVAYLSDYDQQMHTLKELLKGKTTLHLTYEEDIQADPRIAYSRICEFLDLQPAEVSINYSKTNPFPVREMIENIEEVEAALHGTAYSWMLDD